MTREWDPDEPQLSMLHAVVEGAGPGWCSSTASPRPRPAGGRPPPTLAADHEVCRVDAPGHGGSSAFFAGLRTGARLIADQGGPATYVGYSMGGRFVLHVALANPELVRGLVLIGATAGIDDPDERAERHRLDAAMADRLEREGLDRFLDAWLAQPLFAGLTEDMQFRDRTSNEHGRRSRRVAAPGGHRQPGSAVGAARSDRGAGARRRGRATTRSSPPPGAASPSPSAPTPPSRLIPDAGHAAHLENVDAFLALLQPWLAAHGI